MRNKETQRLSERFEQHTTRGDLTIQDESKLKHKVTKNGWATSKDKVGVNVNLEKVQTYEEAFAKIQAATGICDIDDLVQNFINAEDTNFSLFNYANELSADIEKQEGDIAELKAEMEMLRGLGTGQPDANKQKILQDLEARWNKTDKSGEQYDLKFQQALKTLTAVTLRIQSIFNRVGCVPPGGTRAGITESNLQMHLGLIEGRTNEILQLYAALQEGTEDDDEDDQRPFTREELKMKSMRGILKKQDKQHR